MDISLNGKVCIVTGAGSGIGRGSALALAVAGGKLVIADMNLQAADKVVEEIVASGGTAISVKVDVSQGNDVENMIRSAVDHFGGLDVIYNNAGISPAGNILDISEADWDRTIAIDLRSVFLGARYAIPELRKRGGGVILNTAGTLGFRPSKNKAAYSAAKAGVINLTKSVAIDFAQDYIRCNAICPGFVNTPLNKDVDKATVDEMLSRFQPLPGIISPVEIGNLVVFLASDQAKMITGQTFVIDGGQQAGLI